MEELRVRFTHADQGHADPDSFLVKLTGAATGANVIVVSRRDDCDIQFTSVQYPLGARALREGARVIRRLLPSHRTSRDPRWLQSNPSPMGNAQSHIWFTGENVRPPVGDWTGYLSFDLDPLGGRNAYCPLWWWTIGLMAPAQSQFMESAPDLDKLMSHREPESDRPGFIVAFINNPHPMRFHAIRALRRFGPVEVYGRAVGRPVRSKLEVARSFRFVLCFENDVYPGYVTEKAIEAWACGAVPLWWGDDAAGYLNPRAMINAAAFPSLDLMAEHAWRVYRSDDAWFELASQPLVAKVPDLRPAMELIARASGRA